MTVPDPSFSLLDHPWIPVRTVEGTPAEVSLVDLFGSAGTIRRIEGDIPTQTFVLTRLLLAILHRATDGPPDDGAWESLWAGGIPAADVVAYLERHRDRFDLFHPVTPFFQVADLRTEKGEVTELSRLVADVPNNIPFFTNRIGAPLRLSFAEAARWVVHCQAFDTSGIKSGAVDDDRVKGGKGYPIGQGWSGYLGGVLVEGRTLAETLLLNLMPADFLSGKADLPPWERPQSGPAEESKQGRPRGPLDLYVWQSRRIRLYPNGGEVTGVLVCNGDKLTPQNQFGFEPHTAWRRSKAQEAKLKESLVYMPLEHDPARAIWRGLQAMLPSAATTASGGEPAARLSPSILRWIGHLRAEEILPADFPVRLRTTGMAYGSQNAVVDEVVSDELSLAAILLGQDAPELTAVVLACVDAAEQGAQAVGRLASDLADATGRKPPDRSRGDRDGAREQAVEAAYDALDPLFREWLRTVGPDTHATDTQVQWHRLARAALRGIGIELVAAAPPKAWAGRVRNDRLLTAAHAFDRFQRALRTAFPLADAAAAVAS